MRKSTLAMVCLAAFVLLASCKKDVQPTISVATGINYASQNTELFSGDQITVGFSATGENLTKIEMSASQNGTVLYTDSQSIDNEASYLYAHSFKMDAVGTVTISGTVTDAKGHQEMTSFDIICYEKPNAKFVGHYEGDALVNGTMNAVITGMDPVQQELDNQPFATILDIVPGESNNEVIANITINEQANTMIGTIASDDPNKIIFEAINDTYTMNYDANGINIPIDIDMTYTITGTLLNGKLDLSGECKGNGEFNMFIVSGTIELEGIISGSLTKSE